jgi:hypothetical protein
MWKLLGDFHMRSLYKKVMTYSMVIIAWYDDMNLANQSADLLKSEGVPCVIELNEEEHDYERFGFPLPPIQLLVHIEDEPKASLILDKFTTRSRFMPTASRTEEYSLIGAVLAIVGLLATWGSYGEVPDLYLVFPVAMIALGVGVLIFGMRGNH